VEDQELVSNAVAREGLEELGIKIDSKDLQLAHVRNILNPDHSRLHLYFVIDHWQGQVVIQEPELCSELAWFETSKLPENITKDASETLRMIDKKKFFYETNVNE
jgi:ADP-ribose pyrophosphatase YjhB (NUDIX family)